MEMFLVAIFCMVMAIFFFAALPTPTNDALTAKVGYVPPATRTWTHKTVTVSLDRKPKHQSHWRRRFIMKERRRVKR